MADRPLQQLGGWLSLELGGRRLPQQPQDLAQLRPGLRRDPGGTARRDLASLRAVGLGDQGQVGVADGGSPSARCSAICQAVLSQQVRAAHDVGDALRGIVDHHRQLVGE